MLADFALVDGMGKINCIGVGWQVTGIDPATGSTAPQSVVLLVDVAPQHIGETYALEIGLYDDADELVSLPGPVGELQPLRIGQSITATRPVMPGRSDPAWSHGQIVIHFGAGLPLTPGHEYTWRARIDGDDEYRWETSFYVAGRQHGPVVE